MNWWKYWLNARYHFIIPYIQQHSRPCLHKKKKLSHLAVIMSLPVINYHIILKSTVKGVCIRFWEHTTTSDDEPVLPPVRQLGERSLSPATEALLADNKSSSNWDSYCPSKAVIRRYLFGTYIYILLWLSADDDNVDDDVACSFLYLKYILGPLVALANNDVLLLLSLSICLLIIGKIDSSELLLLLLLELLLVLLLPHYFLI